MYILTDKQNVIQHITETLERQEGNNYYLIKNRTIAIPTEFIEEIYEIQEIPEYIEEQKYCYTENGGFYKNVNYMEYYSNEQRIEALEQMMNELILGEE